jgi:hypothetical protein
MAASATAMLRQQQGRRAHRQKAKSQEHAHFITLHLIQA